jgi:hypothetical protein
MVSFLHIAYQAYPSYQTDGMIDCPTGIQEGSLEWVQYIQQPHENPNLRIHARLRICIDLFALLHLMYD